MDTQVMDKKSMRWIKLKRADIFTYEMVFNNK